MSERERIEDENIRTVAGRIRRCQTCGDFFYPSIAGGCVGFDDAEPIWCCGECYDAYYGEEEEGGSKPCSH